MSDDADQRKTVAITGTGSYLPRRVLTNCDLERLVETSDEWIQTRTGISERRISEAGQATSDLAAAAARRAMQSANVSADDIDLIIVATITPDMLFPSTACVVQEKIGARNAFCFDLEAACSGFLFALDAAWRYVRTGGAKTALVIGAETLSCITDWEDRSTCVLFGDGAGAVVLQERDSGRGLIGTVTGSDGGLSHLLEVPGGGSRHPVSAEMVDQRLHYLRMSGNEVFKHAVRCMCDSAQRVLSESGLTPDDVNWVIPHQANMRIIQAIASRFGTGMDKFCVNLQRVGNMSGASVPVALDEAVRSGKIAGGDIIVFVVFGGGFTWGASVMEWSYGG